MARDASFASSATVDIFIQKAKVEFEDGVVPATVEMWRCHKCLFRALPDGTARRVIFHLCDTAYAEASFFSSGRQCLPQRHLLALHFIFAGVLHGATHVLREPAVGQAYAVGDNLAQIAAALLGVFHQGTPVRHCVMRHVPSRREQPHRRLFDGFQLGYRVKYKRAFCHTPIKIHDVPRASRVSCLITDDSMAKSLGLVPSAERSGKAVASGKELITTVTAMRSRVMAVPLPWATLPSEGRRSWLPGAAPTFIVLSMAQQFHLAVLTRLSIGTQFWVFTYALVVCFVLVCT